MTDPLDGATGSPRPGRPDVVVVGSLNLDHICRLPRQPIGGETVLAIEYAEHPGGKGLNQAVAAARIGSTALVGAVGDDEAGRTLREFANLRGIDTSELLVCEGRTGRAFISLLPDGENTIVVAAEANGGISVEDVIAALDTLRPEVVLIQFEIPAAALSAVGEWTEATGARLVVNPSPLRGLDARVRAAADPLIVNTGEAAALAGGEASPADLARQLSTTSRSVVVTAGSAGAIIGAGGVIDVIPAVPVHQVNDTSGAGDHLAGTLAGLLARGASLREATARAVEEASRIVALVRADR